MCGDVVDVVVVVVGGSGNGSNGSAARYCSGCGIPVTAGREGKGISTVGRKDRRIVFDSGGERYLTGTGYGLIGRRNLTGQGQI